MTTSLLSMLAHSAALVTRLSAISKNVENAEFSNALADLGLDLARLKSELSSVLDENTRLKAELRALQSPSAVQELAPLVFREFAYFTAEGDGPFCPGCYDSSGKRIRLSRESRHFKVFGSHSCPACKQPFGASAI